ncbi:MAG: hypothetical protein WBB36_07915 [Chitinophagales bacterium]
MIWLIAIFLIFLLFGYLLLAPFVLDIDSRKDLCIVRFHRLASGRLLVSDGSLQLEISIAGWKKQIDLLLERKPKIKKASKKKSQRKQSRFSFKKILSITRSFKVNKCRFSFDSGNMQLNGYLFPGFYWLSRKTGKSFSINFLGDTELVLQIENNFARIAWAYFHN